MPWAAEADDIVRRLSLLAIFFLLGAAAAVYVFRAELGMAVYARAVERGMSETAASLPDGLHVFLCGTGSPMPDDRRAGPCVGILAGQRAFVVDAGSGGPRKLARMGFPVGTLEGVLLSHLHSDHIDALGELIMLDWVGGNGRRAPLSVTGPRGTREVVAGFNAAYHIDSGYRTAHHGETVAPPDGVGGLARELAIPENLDTLTLLDDGDLRITAIRVDHAPVDPAFGYRFDYRGRSVALSGDTVFRRAFVDAASGVDVMLHEALQPAMLNVMRAAMRRNGRDNTARILNDILDYHATPDDAARAAREAGAAALVLYHTVPPLPLDAFNAAFLGDAAQAFDGPLRIGRDGERISLPVGGTAIVNSMLF